MIKPVRQRSLIERQRCLLPKIFRNRREVGIRVPDNAITREIVRQLDAPLLTMTLPHDEEEDIDDDE